ncbi:multidrug resistance-associated protein 5, partial [Tanacetum coccineum]
DWAEMEVETEGVEARTSTTEGVKARTSTTEGVEPRTKYESDDDSDYQSDKSVDYLSPGEDELIKLRNRMKAKRKAKAKAQDKQNSEMNEPNEEYKKSYDKDGITEDPFISVEKHVERYPMYDETKHWRLRKPKVGEKYTSVAQFKECLTYYALANGFSLWHERSGEVRVVAKCGQRPPRVSDPKKVKQRKQTKNFNFGALVNYKWIAKIFGDKIRANPDIRLCDIADLVMKKYKCKVSLNQCTNAKKYALTEYEKSIGEHYSMLRSYGKAILDSNPGSTVKLGVTVNPDGKTYFDRFYVCFAGLADGWKAGCRKIIALDGCFLKSPNQGEILTAIGRDGNNHIYPVAWAVVNVENKDNWTWFLELLEEDLGCNRGNGLTLMSDQHKGLIEVVKDVMATSKASYPQLFNKIIDTIKSVNLNAHKYLMDKNPKTWSRAFFEVDRGCEAIENGFSECFNSLIVNVRHKPLLTMLEAIRVIVLERMNKMREISRKWNPGVCLNIKKRLEWLKEQQRFWHVIPAGGNLFEVRSGSEGFKVDEGKRTCTCRMWQLSGLPCVHATKVIFLINRVPESYVPAWFEIDMYFVAYHNYVKPVPGMNFWPDQSMYSTVLPPKPRKMLGRPKKKRIRAIGEGGSSTRVSKVGSQGSCSNCKKPGHNKSSCKEPVVEQTPKPKGVVGRPRKKQPVDDFMDVDVDQRVRDEGASGTKGGGIGSRGRGGRGGAARSRCGASGSIGRGAARSRGGAGGSGGASGSKGRGAGGLKRKPMSTARTQKRQEQTQAEPQQTQHEPEQTQVEEQVKQTEDQAEIDLTQVEQTQEQTQEQMQPQEQPQQAALRMPSARILQRKLRKEGSSQNTALNLD